MNLFFTILFVYFALTVFFIFILGISGRIRRSNFSSNSEPLNTIAVVIPAYKEDFVIIDSVISAINHNYPNHRFDVYVLADKLTDETTSILSNYPVHLLPMNHNISTKAKSLHVFTQTLNFEKYNIVFILDADNIMETDCLYKVNSAFNQGYSVIQCHRQPKNSDNALSILDGLSEEIRINLFFSGQRALGKSSDLIGSGIAFERSLLKDILTNSRVQTSIGEDKEMSLQLMKLNIEVEYIDDAIIYDEKVSNINVFKQQRQRWISSQMSIVKRQFDNEFKCIRSAPRFWYHLFLNTLLPRSFILFFIPFFYFVAFILNNSGIRLLIPDYYWLYLMFIYSLTLVISVPTTYLNIKTLRSLFALPSVLFAMFSAAIDARSSSTIFIRTPKNHEI